MTNAGRSRAMVVAAHEERFTIYALKPMTQLRDELESPDGILEESFMPIREASILLVQDADWWF